MGESGEKIRIKPLKVWKVGLELLNLLPTGSEEREVLGVGSIPVAILPSHQNIKTIAS